MFVKEFKSHAPFAPNSKKSRNTAEKVGEKPRKIFHPKFTLFTRLNSVNMILFYIPDIFGIIGNSSIRTEFACIAHIKPLFSCKGHSVAVIFNAL